MSWGSDHDHRGTYAEERHDHDEERWDRERAIDDVRSEIRHVNDRIDGLRADLDFSEIWGAITELGERLTRLETDLTTANGIIGDQGRQIRALGRS
jgi:hypothetical protein